MCQQPNEGKPSVKMFIARRDIPTSCGSVIPDGSLVSVFDGFMDKTNPRTVLVNTRFKVGPGDFIEGLHIIEEKYLF
jgi:hypothetical protein